MSVRDHSAVVIEKFMGLYQRGDPDNTPLDHFRDCENIRFIGNSSFGTRHGIGISQEVLAPLANIKRIYDYPTQTGNTLIILTVDPNTLEGKIYHLVDSTTIFGPLLTITGMNDFAFQPYAGRGYISPFSSSPNALPAPSTAMLATLINGTDIDTGVHKYASTFITAVGETTPSTLTTVSTNTVALANPVLAPVMTELGAFSGSNNLIVGGTYHWKFVYAVDIAGTLVTLPGPASAALVVGAANHAIVLQTPVSFPSGAILVGVYRTVNGGAAYFKEENFTIASNIPTVASGGFFGVGSVSDAVLVTLPAAPVVNNTTTGRVNLSAIPVGGTSVTQRNIYRTKANLTALLLLATIADNVTTIYSDVSADAALGAAAPTTNSALISGDPIVKGLEGQFLYVYAGDGTAARKAAGAAITGSLTIANGSGQTDPGFKIIGVVTETISGYLSPPGALTAFITVATNGISIGNIPTSGDPNVIKRHI